MRLENWWERYSLLVALATLVAYVMLLTICQGCHTGGRRTVAIPRPVNVGSADVEALLDFVAKRLNRGRLDGLRVVLLDAVLAYDRDADGGIERVFADGYADTEHNILYVYAFHPCLAATSLIHEVLHAYGHLHNKNMVAVEKALVRQAVRRFCPAVRLPVLYPPIDHTTAIDLPKLRDAYTAFIDERR